MTKSERVRARRRYGSTKRLAGEAQIQASLVDFLWAYLPPGSLVHASDVSDRDKRRVTQALRLGAVSGWPDLVVLPSMRPGLTSVLGDLVDRPVDEAVEEFLTNRARIQGGGSRRILLGEFLELKDSGPFWIEVKRRDGYPSKNQIDIFASIAATGNRVYVASSLPEVLGILRRERVIPDIEKEHWPMWSSARNWRPIFEALNWIKPVKRLDPKPWHAEPVNLENIHHSNLAHRIEEE